MGARRGAAEEEGEPRLGRKDSQEDRRSTIETSC